MNKDQADIELIEQFINGKLNHDELVDFETRLEEDHEFARKFRLRKAFPSLFNASGNDLIVQDLKEKNIEEELPEIRAEEYEPKRFRPGYIIWPSLGLLLAIALAWFFFIRPKPSVNNTADQTNTPAKSTLALKPASQVQPAAKVKAPEPSPANIPPGQASANQTTALAKPQPEPRKTETTVPKAIELLAPDDNMVVTRGEDLVFKWKMATDSFTNFYIIAESTNKLAWWRGIKPGIRELTVPAINFKSGKFYWYVGRREYKRSLIVME
jgi:hypothetical protein